MTEEEKIPPEELSDKPVEQPSQENLDNNNEQLILTQEPGISQQAEATIQKSENEKMEVHHHGHVHEKKKWKEYLFQFLMLFLAVFCGFLAEYQLEHVIENNREKQFIQSLINDLSADTTRLKVIIEERTKREKRLDSLTLLLNDDSAALNSNKIYFYAVTAARSLAFRFFANDGTMQQLKNSGALRLIRNRLVADSIAKYDVSIRNVLRQGEVEETLIHEYRTASTKIFDALIFDRMLDANNSVQMLSENPPLLPFQKSDLSAWNYRIYSMKALNKANRRDTRLLLQQATNLLNTLIKEYKLQ